ncbi:MAG: hypothetical protein ACE5KI_01350 [Dehalococcoidia bacterium]
MMKVEVGKVRARASVHFELRGSLLAGDIQAGVPLVETRYEIESTEEDAKVAALLRVARSGCWVRAAFSNPVRFEDTVLLNGEAFSLD